MIDKIDEIIKSLRCHINGMLNNRLDDLQKNNQIDYSECIALKIVILLGIVAADTEIIAKYSKRDALDRCDLIIQSFDELRDEIEKQEEAKDEN